MKLSGTALMATGPVLCAAARPPDWGLQLYTVISLLERDFERTLRDVAAIGCKQVETIGSFGRDPAQVRDLFSKYGLVSASQHIAPPRRISRVRRLDTTPDYDHEERGLLRQSVWIGSSRVGDRKRNLHCQGAWSEIRHVADSL